MKRVFRAAAGLLWLVLLAGQAAAAEKSTYIVAPFFVQGPQGFTYLERSIPQMLTSRLYWKDRVEPARSELPVNIKPVSSQAEAEKLLAQFKADYVVWGTVTIVENDCSLDVRVLHKSGKAWPQVREAKSPQLIAAITGISDAINREVFNRPTSAANISAGSGTGGTGGRGRVNQMNPEIMVNETSAKEVYLNPQFRYSGASVEDDSRLRSQALNFSSIGMEVVDADSDGKNEIFLLDDRVLRAYSFAQGRLEPLGEFFFPANSQCLSVRSLPHPSGKAWIIVNTVDKGGQPLASILTFSGGTFREEMKNIRYYLNVVKMPPSYMPVLIGQEAQPPRLFKIGVNEMVKQGDRLVPSRRIALPSEVNVLNFTYLPGSRGERDSDKLIVLTGEENLRVYNSKGSRLAQTSEKYSGSALGLEIAVAMPGLGKDDVTIPSVFYIPMRMLAIDLERDGNWELLVNRPISTASQIFDRYRFFPQSEIHSLFWDGIGLNLQWKTRRIKGSMVDYTVADANNDGIPDLVACLNTHPGALGVSARKTMIMLYPLDVSLTSPGTAVDKDDMYD
jgi:hypothetical protein